MATDACDTDRLLAARMRQSAILVLENMEAVTTSKYPRQTQYITLLVRERTAASAGFGTRIAAWQRALQMCEQLLVLLGKPHGWAQGGHSPLWQRCFMAW